MDLEDQFISVVNRVTPSVVAIQTETGIGSGVIFDQQGDVDAVPDHERQPLEEGSVTISRAGTTATYPARVVLVASMNPCPCGHAGDPAVACTCLPDQVDR